MAEVITYETLREIQRNERRSEKLSDLSDDFYESVNSYLNRDAHDEVTQTELRNAREIIMDIKERRERKILNQALRAVRANEQADINEMTSAEKKLFDEIVNVLIKYKETIENNGKSGETNGKSAESKSEESEDTSENDNTPINEPENEKGKDYIKVKILEDVPQIVGADLEDYGPFKAGDIVELPAENAKIFIESGKAEEEN